MASLLWGEPQCCIGSLKVSGPIIQDLQTYLDILQRESELLVIDVPVSPYLEIAEIHRRVISRGGPALLFTNVEGSTFPVATNLFGTGRQAFGLQIGALGRHAVVGDAELERQGGVGTAAEGHEIEHVLLRPVDCKRAAGEENEDHRFADGADPLEQSLLHRRQIDSRAIPAEYITLSGLILSKSLKIIYLF